MKIKVTEIKATTEDLRQSKTLADAFSNALRLAFIPSYRDDDDDDDDDEEEEE